MKPRIGTTGSPVNKKYRKRKKLHFWKDDTKMAAPKEILEDMDFAQGQLMASDMSDDFKKRYNTLFNISREATNGISPEDKIQKMTEAIALLATAQVGYMIEIQNKITSQITKANREQCKECQAMKHAKEFDKTKEEEERFRGYLEEIGIDPKKVEKMKKKSHGVSEDRSWNDIMKDMLTKPYIYVVFCLMAISPYSVEIIKTVGSFFK